MSKGWRVKKNEENQIQCSLVKEPTIYIESMPKQKIILLMGKYPSQEWLAYLVGRIAQQSGDYFVEDISVPPHKEAHGASAEAEPFHIPVARDGNCIGIIHSHHTMGAFHSQTDKDYVDANFPVSITVARKGESLEYDAVSYQLTLCGKRVVSHGHVKYVLPPPGFDTEAFLKEATGNIDKGKKVYTPVPVIYNRYAPRFTGFADENGRVMTQTEIDQHMREIFKDY